jgi:hypothetical protein
MPAHPPHGIQIPLSAPTELNPHPAPVHFCVDPVALSPPVPALAVVLAHHSVVSCVRRREATELTNKICSRRPVLTEDRRMRSQRCRECDVAAQVPRMNTHSQQPVEGAWEVQRREAVLRTQREVKGWATGSGCMLAIKIKGLVK